jgi:hypothetical protein
VGVAPDDFLLLTRDMERQEIYALNLKGLLSDLRHRYPLRFGGRDGIRTHDLLIANEEKSRLRCGTTIT